MTMNGKFPGGQILNFDLKSKGVGLPEKNPNLSAAIVKEVKKYGDQVASGKIKVPTEP
jgi:basic membrane protein A